MTRIRGQKKTHEKDDHNAPLPSPRPSSINPSTDESDAASQQAADPVIIKDTTVPLHHVEVISSIPVILDPNTATDQQGRMETVPAPSTLGIESTQPPDLAISRSILTTPVQNQNKRHRAHDQKSVQELCEEEWFQLREAVSRRLTASASECMKLHDQVQELKESNEKLTDSAAHKDADLVSLRSENEALKEQIATRDMQAKAYLAEAEQAKKASEDLTKDLEAERKAAILRDRASPQFGKALKLLCHLAFQYGYTLAVDEIKALDPDFDITVLLDYKDLYNPKAGELCEKLKSEFINGEDIVKKYL